MFYVVLFKKYEAIENNSAVFADAIDSESFRKFCNFDAITAYGMDGGIGVAARFAGFDSTFFTKVAAAGGKNSCVFGIVTDFLHGFPKELASAFVGNLLCKISFLAGKVRNGIFFGEDERIFEVMKLCDKRFGISHCGWAHIAGMVHSAKVLFAETTKRRIAGNKSCGNFFAIIKTYGFGKFFNFLIHRESASFRLFSDFSIDPKNGFVKRIF